MPATAQIRIAADTVQFRNAMRDVEKQMNTLSTLSKKTSNSIAGVFKTMGKVSAVGLFVGMPSAIIASQRAFQKFEKELMEAFTLLPNANKAMFEKMKKDAIDFSMDFGIQPEEVARGMYQSLSAGMNPMTLTQDFMKIAQQSAIAGVTDLKTSVDALTNVVNSYGEGQYEVGYVADQMFHAVSMSKMTYRELADYMYQIIPTAAAMKVRLDDLLGSISALAATGTLTRVGTTQLRQFLIELSREGDKANSAFLQGSGGIPVQKFIRDGGRMIEIVKIMGDVARRRRTDLRNLFGSVEAGNAALTLFNSDAYKGMVNALETDAEGAMSKAFEKIYNSQEERVKRLQRTFMSVFIKLGDVMKPMFDDILTYFEEVGQKIKDYKWDELATNFNNVWYKIKKAISEKSFWKMFELGAELAFKKVNYYIKEYIAPALVNLSSQLALIFGGEYNMGDSLLTLLKGVGSYLLVLAKEFGLAIIDAMKGPIAFITAGLQTAAVKMFDTFASTIPDIVKDTLGIKGKEERQEDYRRQVISNSIMQGETDDRVFNDVIYGKGYDDKMQEIIGYQKDLKELNTFSGQAPRMSDKDLAYKYQNFTDRQGFIQEYKMKDMNVLKQYRLDRGDKRTHTKALEEKIQQLQEEAKSLIQMPSLVNDDLTSWTGVDYVTPVVKRLLELSDSQRSAIDTLRDGEHGSTEEIYKSIMGSDLFQGIDLEDFYKGKMGKDYETVLKRLESAIGSNNALSSQADKLELFYDRIKERRDKIFDKAFELGEFDVGSMEEANLMDRYKQYSDDLQKAYNKYSEMGAEGREDDREGAIDEMNEALVGLGRKYAQLRHDADNLEPTSPEAMAKREELLAPLKSEIDRLQEELTNMYLDLGDAPPRPKAEDADVGDPTFEREDRKEDPFDVAVKLPTVKADSKQRVGGGGGFFGYVRKPIDRLIDSQQNLGDKIEELTDTMRNERKSAYDGRKYGNQDADRIQERGFAKKVDKPIDSVEGLKAYLKGIREEFEIHGIERSIQHESTRDGVGGDNYNIIHEKEGMKTLMNRMNNMGLGEIFDIESVMKSSGSDLSSTAIDKASMSLDQSASRLLSAVQKLDELQPSIEGVETINFS